MKTKRKSFLALLTALAVGTSVATIALATHGMTEGNFNAFADAEDGETQLTQLEFGTNSITLTANVSQTFALDATQAGLYGFELPYEYVAEEITTDDETEVIYTKVYDEFTGSISISVSEHQGVVYTLSASNPFVEIQLDSPASATVTFVSATDVTVDLHMTFDIEHVNLYVGGTVNTLELTANEEQNALINSKAIGYYTFTQVSGTVYFVINDETYILSERVTEFTVYISNLQSFITVYSTTTVTASFTITYSEGETDDTSVGTLTVGSQTVDANGDGVEYAFTSESGGTYSLSCQDTNAYVMVEDGDYWEHIELFVATRDQYYQIVEVTEWKAYTFTLGAGESLHFLMSTEDFNDDTYVVVIAEV